MKCTGATDRLFPAALTNRRSPRDFHRYPTKQMLQRRFTRLAVATVVGVLILVPCLYVFFTIQSLRTFPDAYASDWTSIFVIEHLRTSGAWPDGWSDLHDEYDRLANASHYAWTFDELQSRVWFDFDADMQEVREAEPPKTVFRLTSGRRVSFNGDPNLLIREYLRTGDDPHRIDPPIRSGG